MLFEPTPTPYDLNFYVGQTPVRVHPFFWLGTVILGWDFTKQENGLTGLGFLLLWVACVFISILLHELGHVWMGRAFGARGYIVLWVMGGLAIGSKSNEQARWQRVLVSAAGPGIQFVLFGIVWAVLRWGLPELLGRIDLDWYLRIAMFLFMLKMINLFWPLLNLLPIWPLDGGQISRELCEATSRRNGVLTSLYLSAALSGLLAIHCYLSRQDGGFPILKDYFQGDMFMGMFFLMFCVGSIQGIQQERERYRPWGDDEMPWER